MTTIDHYNGSRINRIMKHHGAFFAFSSEQYELKARPGVRYASLGAGLIAPMQNACAVMEDLKTSTRISITADIAENGIDAIIMRELANHEANYTRDYSDALAALRCYGVTEEKMREVFPVYLKIEDDYERQQRECD